MGWLWISQYCLLMVDASPVRTCRVLTSWQCGHNTDSPLAVLVCVIIRTCIKYDCLFLEVECADNRSVNLSEKSWMLWTYKYGLGPSCIPCLPSPESGSSLVAAREKTTGVTVQIEPELVRDTVLIYIILNIYLLHLPEWLLASEQDCLTLNLFWEPQNNCFKLKAKTKE